ncbi:MAG TPA: DUF86 domain-containing protein [Pseudogracilibacillus sp.]|nr:DUF86 domain-containing protein [Pseudogracilibacillus sp.]
MYFVNRSEIEAILSNMDDLLTEVKEQKTFSLPLQQLGLERLIHVLIESILDVGNMMIDGFIMRDPGSYHDIIDILIDEKVLPSEEEKQYKEFIDLRQMIVQNYLAIDQEKLQEVFFSSKDTLLTFSARIREYLENELGVANAFSNEP